MPGSNGPKIIYNLIVKKILRKYEEKIDSVVKNMGEVEEYVYNEGNKPKNNKLKKLKKMDEMNMDDAVKAAQEISKEEKEHEN